MNLKLINQSDMNLELISQSDMNVELIWSGNRLLAGCFHSSIPAFKLKALQTQSDLCYTDSVHSRSARHKSTGLLFLLCLLT